jgi:hypothetical protein
VTKTNAKFQRTFSFLYQGSFLASSERNDCYLFLEDDKIGGDITEFFECSRAVVRNAPARSLRQLIEFNDEFAEFFSEVKAFLRSLSR